MRDPLIDRLAKLDTCAVSDALDALQIVGVALGLQALTIRKRIVGEALTVQLGRADGRVPDRHLCTAAVEASGPDRVIVIAHDGRTDVAGWGGILSLGAVANGASGVVIDGACRDIDEATDLLLPIYGRAGVPTTARGRIIEYAWNIPINMCGTKVSPGDLVIADASGVAFIPAGAAARVIELGETIALREMTMAAEVRDGKPISEVMSKKYETMLANGSV
jgi:4-hydroxy-4-methyl-2-oxoglutarate aldolase